MDNIARKPTNTILISGILIAFFYYPLLGHLIYLGRGYSVATVFTSRLFIWLEVALLYLYARKVEKSSFLLWSEKSYGFWFYPAAFGALYMLAIGAGVIANIPRFFGWHENRQVTNLMMTMLNKNIALLVFGALTAGFTEELIFRAYLVPRLELLFKNTYMPVILSALMFSAIHYRYYSLNETIFTFLIGGIFAIHYQWYRNIKVLIFTHAFIDLVSFLLFRMAQVHHIPLK